MLIIRPNNYSVNFYLTPHFDCKNPFLPTKVPRIPLTSTERRFLKIYMPFAEAMKAIYESKTPLRDKEVTMVAVLADVAGMFLIESRFRNKEVTDELTQFLFTTNQSLVIGKWLGSNNLHEQGAEGVLS